LPQRIFTSKTDKEQPKRKIFYYFRGNQSKKNKLLNGELYKMEKVKDQRRLNKRQEEDKSEGKISEQEGSSDSEASNSGISGSEDVNAEYSV
jgi:hypothetical protein